MSSRWYPIFQKGNPQLRIFLPNFWMKLVRPTAKQPPNVVQFITPIGMTDHDIKNYLEKIYKVNVVEVRSEVAEGELKRVYGRGNVIKDDDYRRAFITLPKEEKFEFPDIITERTEKEESEYKRVQKETREGYRTFSERNKERKEVPGWFSI